MSDIFEEVEEGLRQDKAGELWARFAPFVWGLLGLAVAAVAAREYLMAQEAETVEARAQVLEEGREALEAGDYTRAGERLTGITQEGGRASPIAAHYLARVRFEGNGDLEAAQSALGGVAEADGTPFQKLALLKQAYMTADQASLAELESMLGALVDDQSAFGALSRELVAAKAFSEGDAARARQMFGHLKFDANAPEGVVQRADIALATIPPAVEPPAAVDDTAAEPALEEATE